MPLRAATARAEYRGEQEIIMFEKLELISKTNCLVGEGPMWDERTRRLYFVDIVGSCYYVMDYSSGEKNKIDTPQQLGCMAMCENGDLILSMQDGVYFRNFSGELTLAHRPADIKGRRFNDGKVGPDGCYYVGTTDDNHEGAFYRLSGGVLTELFDHCGCSNGLDWSEDTQKLYYCDSREQKVECFDFSMEKHDVSSRTSVLEMPEADGSFDGMTIDAAGNLWTAVWGGWCVLNIEPSTGTILKKVELPVEKVSSCAFAGDDMRDLIITTASVRTSLEEQPLAGCTFRVRCDVPGYHINRYQK